MGKTAEAFVASGRAAWPGVPFSVDAIERRLASRTPDHDPPVHVADLCLAFACADGVVQAISTFEHAFISKVDSFVVSLGSSPVFADEVKQRLRERLLVGPPPKIAEYSGRGPLGGWLRVASIRTAIDIHRAAGTMHGEADAGEVLAKVLDPEMQLLRARHRGAIEDALRGALGRLSPKERNLLRMHFGRDWTLDRIGKSYRVHRATVARWIAAVRQTLLDEVSRELGVELGLDTDELRSLAALLRSQVDAGLSSHWRGR